MSEGAWTTDLPTATGWYWVEEGMAPYIAYVHIGESGVGVIYSMGCNGQPICCEPDCAGNDDWSAPCALRQWRGARWRGPLSSHVTFKEQVHAT